MSHRPNILVIMADQFRAASLGVLGEDPVHTPHLDRLATEGCVARQAVSSYPVLPMLAIYLWLGRRLTEGLTLGMGK